MGYCCSDMDIADIRALYDRHERLDAAFPQFSRERANSVVRMIGFSGRGSMVVHSALSEEDADRVIDEELAYFRGHGMSFEWKLYSHDRPADLKARLAAHGFSIGDDEAIMALDLDARPAILSRSCVHDVRRVTDEGALADFAAVDRAAWPDDDGRDWIDELRVTLRDEPERVSAYVAYVDGVPVSAARVCFPVGSPFASLWGGATLGPYRKRGVYTDVLAARAREAVERSYRFLTIDASPMSRPIAERHGFKLLSISNPCKSPAIA